jgi:hypothetical protein
MIRIYIIKISIIFILIGISLKLIDNNLYLSIKNKILSCLPYKEYFTDCRDSQNIYPVSITNDTFINNSNPNKNPTLDSPYLTNINKRIKKVISEVPINLNKYLNSMRKMFNTPTTETNQLIKFIISQIQGDTTEHKLELTKFNKDISKTQYHTDFYVYEIQFNCNYYTNKIGFKQKQMFFLGELTFNATLFAKPQERSILVAPLNISKKLYDVLISQLTINKVSPKNQFLPGLDKSNNQKIIGETTFHPNAKVLSSDAQIQYENISSILPDTLKNQESEYDNETSIQYTTE